MIKTTIRGFEVRTKNGGFELFENGEKVAENLGFRIQEIDSDHVALLFEYTWRSLKGKNGMKITLEQLEELKNLQQAAKDIIDEYFNNLITAKVSKLNNGSFILEENKEISKLNESYYNDKASRYIKENKQFIVNTKSEYEKNEIGQMELVEEFVISLEKEIVEEIKVETEEEKNKRVESIRNNNDRFELAEILSDEEFEDATGLPREHYKLQMITKEE